MSNIEQTTRIYTNRCLSDCLWVLIARAGEIGNDSVRIVMTDLKDYEEQLLNKQQALVIRRGEFKFEVHPQYVIAYGDLDFTPNSDDITLIDKTGAFNKHRIRIFMPSEYHYDTHTVVSDRPAGRWFETDNPVTFLPFLHGCLNKPTHTIIFKEYYNFSQMTKEARIKARRQKMYNDNREAYLAKQKQYREMRKREKREAKLRAAMANLKFKTK